MTDDATRPTPTERLNLLELCTANAELAQKLIELKVELDSVRDVNVGAERETLRLRNIIDASPDESAKLLNEASERIADLEHQLAFCEKLTEQIETLEDQRVSKAVRQLSEPLLRWLGTAPDVGLDGKDRTSLRLFVAFEVARRIQYADLDLPLYKSQAEIVETPLDKLFEELEQALEWAEKVKTMTEDEREKRYEAFIRAKGWLKDGEQLGRPDEAVYPPGFRTPQPSADETQQPSVDHCLSLFYRLRARPGRARNLIAEDLAALEWLVNDHLERERDRQRREQSKAE